MPLHKLQLVVVQPSSLPGELWRLLFNHKLASFRFGSRYINAWVCLCAWMCYLCGRTKAVDYVRVRCLATRQDGPWKSCRDKTDCCSAHYLEWFVLNLFCKEGSSKGRWDIRVLLDTCPISPHTVLSLFLLLRLFTGPSSYFF